MGTAGIYGIRKNGKDKITYSNFDSYPDSLGTHMIKFSKAGINKLNELYDRILLVNTDNKPTQKQIDICIKNNWVNLDMSNKSYNDWYCLLRNLQGKPCEYLNADNEIYMIDDSDFIKESLFCEYGYIINLDTNMLEFWKGFQTTPQNDNRYGCKVTDSFYYPCKMVLEISLEEINNIQSIINRMNSYN